MTSPAPLTGRALVFGREPAMLAEVAASLLVVLHLFVLPDFTPVIQGTVNAVILALASIYTAWKVQSDSLLPAVLGGFKALVAMVVALGLPLDAAQQAGILTFLSLAAGLVVRANVMAPVTVDGQVVYSRPAA
jgi:hypothetical protein